TTGIRKSIALNDWKSYGYKSGQELFSQKNIQAWVSHKGVNIDDGVMTLENALIEKKIDSLSWRFECAVNIKIEQNAALSFSLGDNKRSAIDITIKNGELKLISAG